MTVETKLREALHDRAGDVPATSIARVSAHEYHPRTRRLRPPVAIGAAGAAGAAGTAGAIAAIVSLTAGASTAFAGWKATPTTPSAIQLATAKLDCTEHPPIAGVPLVLTDTRGPFTFQVYANDKQSSVCTTGPSFQSVNTNQSSAAVNVPADRIAATVAEGANDNGQSYAFADGRVGSDVSGVTLVLTNGTDVIATVQNGWFVAWWPGTATVKSAQLATSSGTQTQKLDMRSSSRVPGPNGPTPSSVQSGGSGSLSGSGDGVSTSPGGPGGPTTESNGTSSNEVSSGQSTSSFRTSSSSQ